MCGIAGRFHPYFLPPDEMWHDKADGLLAHRGPDGNGHYNDANCELVHRRLAIVDLSPTGQQPMWNEDHSVCVIFNGEIYNHRNLRADLESKGHFFRSTSDTEALVHLYEEHGPDMVEQLRGIFAFAIYDKPERCLFLARDRFGIKPLYYLIKGDQCVFASEIKALLTLADYTPAIDRQACYDYLGLGYMPEPFTGFTEIRALEKGTTLTVSAKGRRLSRFHHVKAQPDHLLSLPDAIDSASSTLLQAVRSQAVADVPVAALLSGGIDSSLIVAAYGRAASEPPATFNVCFPDKDYDETPIAQAVSNHCGTRHTKVDLTDWSITPDLVVYLLSHFDQPFADTSLIPTYLVAKAIREQGIKCTLSGDGGDEAFGGYARFWRANRFIQLMQLPKGLLDVFTAGGKYLASWTRDIGRQMGKASQLACAGKTDSSVLIAGLSNYLSEEQKRDLVLPSARGELLSIYRHFDGHSPAGVNEIEELSLRMTENLFSVGLPSDMLRKVDMMSMLASVEVRVPMLDEKVVEAGLSLPHGLKTDGRNGKMVLRGLARRWLPDQVATHPKHGFGIPVDRMASSQLYTMLEDLLLPATARVRSFLNTTLIEHWMKSFKDARADNQAGAISRGGLYQRIFILLALELWLRKNRLSW